MSRLFIPSFPFSSFLFSLLHTARSVYYNINIVILCMCYQVTLLIRYEDTKYICVSLLTHSLTRLRCLHMYVPDGFLRRNSITELSRDGQDRSMRIRFNVQLYSEGHLNSLH
ncbi:GSCOCG00005357001-RA-CDS [Cotesia congregata]|nr:GSCOCG00005357001-RA-CDS [Cotesia congregata]